MEKSGTNQTVSAAIWLACGRLMGRSFDVVTLLVLARVLGPADFGLVAISMTFVFVTEAALELPLMQALIRLPYAEAQDYDTALTLGLLRGGILCTLLCSIAVPVSLFYDDARLALLLCALSLAPAVRGIISPKMAAFAQRLDYRPEFVLDISGKLATLLCSCVVVAMTHSYWAIAAGTLAGPVCQCILSYIIAPHRPRFTLRRWRLFAEFLGWNSISQICSAINWQMDRLVLGRLEPPSVVGRFTVANDLANIPTQAFLLPLLRPLMSAFTLLQADPGRLAWAYRRASSAVMLIGLPVLTGLALVASPVVQVFLGAKWLDAAPILQLIALAGLPLMLAAPLAPLAMSLGRTRIMAQQNAWVLLVKTPLTWIGISLFGVLGAVLSRLSANLVTAAIGMTSVRKMTGVTLAQQGSDLARPGLSTLIMATSVLSLRQLLVLDAAHPIVEIAVCSGVGAAVYGACLFTFWRLQGRPSGAEAIAINKISRIISRVRVKNF